MINLRSRNFEAEKFVAYSNFAEKSKKKKGYKALGRGGGKGLGSVAAASNLPVQLKVSTSVKKRENAFCLPRSY